MTPKEITNRLVKDIEGMTFSPPVSYVYNPLIYARKSYDLYIRKYGRKPKEIFLLGMNPGPFGMAQTGVPFGEVEAVKNWLKIETSVGTPEKTHPKRPVDGFQCSKSEVSGRRVWGWAERRFGDPEQFFSRFFVTNYCPLIFIEESGRNRTPDKLPKIEKQPLLEVCNKALRETVKYYSPEIVIGVGAFAEKQAQAALQGLEVKTGKILHPSPANPKANRGWEDYIENELRELGIEI